MALEKLAKTLVRKAGQAASKAQPFYSPIDEAIAAITQGKGTGAQMLAELMKTKGVAKELKDRPAIKKALEASKDTKVTKADVERLAAENPVASVQETTIGAPYKTGEMDRLLDQWAAQNSGPTADAINRGETLFATRQLAEEAGDTDVVNLIDRVDSEAKFQKYTIPGGENYREVLIRLPQKNNDQIIKSVDGKYRFKSADGEVYGLGYATKEGAESARASSGISYQSPHFNEPNIFAHARVSDRVGPNGERILHVEEVQSDWHQAGRKKGYKGQTDAQSKELLAERERLTAEIKGIGNRIAELPNTDINGYTNLIEQRGALVRRKNELADQYGQLAKAEAGKVPDAPFKQNWHELVMKRLLDDAARNGYDKVVITPGKTHIDRYTEYLRANLDSIEYEPYLEDGKQMFELAGYKNGAQIFSEEAVTPERMRELLGKSMHEKIMQGHGESLAEQRPMRPDWKRITGDDISVGGEGMKGFYDQIVPSYLNDYGKKYGVTVGTHDLVVPRKNPLRDIQEAVDEGYITAEEAAEMNPYQRRMFINQFQTRVNPVHSFDITPQMREEITTKGQPLYQVAPPVAIGAGAAMQEEEPSEYGKGGAVKNVAKILMPRAEQEANFAKFLAESKAPMRLYHGTTATEGGKGEEAIRRFKPSKEGALGSGVYLTPNTNYAEQYTFKGAGNYEGGNTLPVHAQIKNPLILDGSASRDPMIEALMRLGMGEPQASRMVERAYENKGYIGKEVESRARAQGYDGLMQYDRDGQLGEVVSYNPNAIKSAIGNEGTYDITNPDMNKAGGGAVRKALKAVIKPTDYLSARAIEPPHGVRDIEKLNLLVKSMKENGWQGRPILTYDAGRGDEALTGSHRIKAATQADIEVPIYRIENAGDYVDKNGKSIFDVGFMELEDQVKWLNQFGDKNAAQLLKQEPTDYGKGGTVKRVINAVLPKGQQAILPAAESAANLERFLAESAIKDRMYHGTFRGGFSTFDRNKTTEWRQPSMDTVGSWFSNNPSEAGGAGMYASGQGASIYPVHLSIKNPKEYNTFNDFLVDMHSAAGRELPKSAPGLGSTEELRQKLKAEGYDGIAFKQTANQSLMQDIQEMQDAVKRARMEELSMKRQEREPYTMKRERLEQTLNSMNKELSQSGSSTEFDEQRVFIPLEPTQIKSAIGNRGTYDINEADINKAKGGQVTNDAMWIALQNKQLRKKHGN